MHKKVAKKYMSRILCDYLQKAVSSTKVDLSKVQDMTSRAVELIDESDHREEIYKEAGDMIFMYQTTLDRMLEHMATIEYIVSKMTLTSAADDLKPTLRKELEKALKGDT